MFVIMGALCDFASLSFAPQSVVMPVGSLTLVANVFFAHFWLGEKLGTTDIIGTSFIVGGAVLIAVAYGALGKTASEHVFYDADDLVELYHRWVVFFFGITVLGILGGFFYVMKKAERLVEEGKQKTEEYMGLLAKVHPISYAAVAGIFGSFSVTFGVFSLNFSVRLNSPVNTNNTSSTGKAIGELLAATSSDEKGNQFEEPFMYVFLFCMIVTILMQTHYLAHGLEFFDALFIVPVFQCFFIVLSIMGGALYWKEMASFNASQWTLFPIGVLVTLYVVFERTIILPNCKKHNSNMNTKQVRCVSDVLS